MYPNKERRSPNLAIFSGGCYFMQKNAKSSLKDVIVVGFAMFAIFFGAGNLIFPPYLGMVSVQVALLHR